MSAELVPGTGDVMVVTSTVVIPTSLGWRSTTCVLKQDEAVLVLRSDFVNCATHVVTATGGIGYANFPTSSYLTYPASRSRQ